MPPAESTIATPRIAAFSDCAPDQRPNEWAQGVHPEDLEARRGRLGRLLRAAAADGVRISLPPRGRRRCASMPSMSSPCRATPISAPSAISPISSRRAASCTKSRTCSATPSIRRPSAWPSPIARGRFLRFNDAFRTPARLRRRRAVGSFHSGAHPPGGSCGVGREPRAAVDWRGTLPRLREALPAQGRYLHLGAHDHRARARRQPRRLLGRVSARHHPAAATHRAADCSSGRCSKP